MDFFLWCRFAKESNKFLLPTGRLEASNTIDYSKTYLMRVGEDLSNHAAKPGRLSRSAENFKGQDPIGRDELLVEQSLVLTNSHVTLN